MTHDEREPTTTKVDLSRAADTYGPHPADEHSSSNVMRLSTPEIANAAAPRRNKRVMQAGIACLSVMALSTLVWLNTRMDPQGDVETKLLPATLVMPRAPAVKVAAPSTPEQVTAKPERTEPELTVKAPEPSRLTPAATSGRPNRRSQLPTRTAASRVEPVAAASGAPPAARAAAVEAGADLGLLQRPARARIDVENPY